MNTRFVTLLLVSALVSCAVSSTFPLSQIEQVISGFATGMGSSSQAIGLDRCSVGAETIISKIKDLAARAAAGKVDQEEAIEELAQTGEIVGPACEQTFETGFEFITNALGQATSGDTASKLFNLFKHSEVIRAAISTVRADVASQNFFQAGKDLARIHKLIFSGSDAAPSRAFRQLTPSDDVIAIGLDIILALQGFFETANTTVNATHYSDCVNGAVGLIAGIPAIEQALATQDIAQITYAIGEYLIAFSVTDVQCTNVKNEIVDYINYIRPYLQDTTRYQAALTSLFREQLPDTLDNVANIIRGERAQNWETLGWGVGGLWAEFTYALVA